MQICPKCGARNDDGARFCSQCATPLVRAPEERKLVTVLFADITGSTGLGEKLDPETLKDVMSSYFSAMSEEIEGEGGTVEKFIGDAVMAAFGVPTAHEDDPARAARAALRMRDRLQDLNVSLEQRHGVTLQMRIGINSGEVIATTTPGQTVGMVSGDAVNVAARLEQSAGPGEIVVAERTARATRGFEYASMGDAAIRGRGEDVAAVKLVGAATTAPVQERGIPGLRAPIVGRDRELELLRSVFDRVSGEGRAHLVTIYGDPGIGKSRLVREFTGSLGDAEVLFGRCLPYGEGVTYWPLAEILKARAGVLDNDAADVALGKISASTIDWLQEVQDPARAAAVMAFAIGLDDGRYEFRDLPPRQIRIETHDAWRAFFAGISRARPVVAIIEDIHWADAALLDLLEELAERTPGPVLFVCPARHELTQRRATWGGGKRNFSSIALEPLTLADAELLVEQLLAVDELPAAVRNQILERAEGNPFFVEEIIRQLIDEGRIVRSGERWRAASAITDAVIPDTVQGVLAARIDLLEGGEKRALQSAAVVGRVFWTGPVARLLNGDADVLDRSLRTLEDRDLIVSRLGSSVAGDREYIFKHVLTRDVAYGSLPRRERGVAHARVAEWIEEAAGQRRREFADLLAHHYSEAYERALSDHPDDIERLRAKTFEYLLLAAEEARSKTLLERANELASRALPLAESIEDRAAAHESLGMTALYDYRGRDAWQWLKQAVDDHLSMPSYDPLTVAMLCARAVESPTRWPAGVSGRLSEDVVAPYLEIGFANVGPEPTEARFRLLLAKSMWAFAYSEDVADDVVEECRRAGEEALAIAQKLGRPELASAAYDGLASYDFVRGYNGRLVELNAARVEIARSLRDPWEIGDAFQTAADNQIMVGEYPEALALGAEGLERSSSGPAVWAACRAWRAIAAFWLGDWDQLLDDLRTLIETYDRPTYITGSAKATGALVHQLRGNEAQADPLMQQLVDGPPEPFWRFAPYLARVIAMRGDSQRALDMLERAIQERGLITSLAYGSMCDIVASNEVWGRAAEVTSRARAWAAEARLRALPIHADRLEGRAAFAAGDTAKAITLLSSAHEAFGAIGARWDQALSAMWLGEARGDEGRDLIEAALVVFSELGSVREIERARSLLR